jgi:hypothetical protein
MKYELGLEKPDSYGSFAYRNDMKNLFKITPHNIFLIKFSYWFAL